MNNKGIGAALSLGLCIFLGLTVLGFFISNAVVRIKSSERTIAVKGLSEREVSANLAIWPIVFKEANNDLNLLFSGIQKKNMAIVAFLKRNGFRDNEIFASAPAIVDKQAQEYESTAKALYRYTGRSTITVYSDKIDSVRSTMAKLGELGKEGIAISGEDYQSKTDFIFTKLNDVKPAMIEEATKNGREAAEKFAQDSKSILGKIKTAAQGQFIIENRDNNTPYIKKVRIVSTIEYYLSD